MVSEIQVKRRDFWSNTLSAGHTFISSHLIPEQNESERIKKKQIPKSKRIGEVTAVNENCPHILGGINSHGEQQLTQKNGRSYTSDVQMQQSPTEPRKGWAHGPCRFLGSSETRAWAPLYCPVLTSAYTVGVHLSPTKPPPCSILARRPRMYSLENLNQRSSRLS